MEVGCVDSEVKVESAEKEEKEEKEKAVQALSKKETAESPEARSNEESLGREEED